MIARTSSNNFVKETVKVGTQVSIPAIWCKIFARSLLKIAKKLGIIVEVVPHDGCLWIVIVSAPYFSDASHANLDIVGFDYHPELESFSLITVVGFRNCWYNKKLYPKLNSNSKAIATIENHYATCHFDRQVRFNKIRETFYQYIRSYDTLTDYLRDVIKYGIYFSSRTPKQCIAELNKFGVTEGKTIDKLNNTSRESYNWLEYLHISSNTRINSQLFLVEDTATIAEFERQLEVHLTGMLLIDTFI